MAVVRFQDADHGERPPKQLLQIRIDRELVLQFDYLTGTLYLSASESDCEQLRTFFGIDGATPARVRIMSQLLNLPQTLEFEQVCRITPLPSGRGGYRIRLS